MQDTKAAKETQLLQAFYDMMAKDSSRAFYGPGHVQAAHELGAVQTLLITDTLFRVNNVAQVGIKICPSWELIPQRCHASAQHMLRCMHASYSG